MQNFHVKSIILGIGIGIVLTSILSMIYLAGSNPMDKISEDDVKKLARQYGMIDGTELFKTRDQQTESKNDTSKAQDSSKTANSKVSPSETAKPAEQSLASGQEAVIAISRGDSPEVVAGKLLKAGLITDSAAFVKEVSSMGQAENIRTGEYNIRKGNDMKSIITAITAAN